MDAGWLSSVGQLCPRGRAACRVAGQTKGCCLEARDRDDPADWDGDWCNI